MDGTITVDLARNLLRWRQDTPGCSTVIHLNNAGAALMPRVVTDAVTAHLQLENQVGGYEAAEARAPAIREAYGALGRVLGARAENVALVQNSTVAFAQ